MELAEPNWSLWLENSALSQAIQQWIWLYPSIEALHIISLATLFGAVAMFDLRLLGYSRQILVTDMARHLLPWTYVSFAAVAFSGFLLFAVDAREIADNPAFRLKLILIAATGINAAVFHIGPFQSVKRWNRGVTSPFLVRTIAIFSLSCWTGVIICGRLIAYL